MGAFRTCVQHECLKTAEKVKDLTSAAQTSVKFGLAQASKHGKQNLFDSDSFRTKDDVQEELLRCERRCASRHWPQAELKAFIGSVALEMAGGASDQTGGKLGR